MKRNLMIFIALGFLFSLSGLSVNAQNRKQSVIESCQTFFGKIFDEKNNLFEVNEDFILQVKFNSNEEIYELSVIPKYWLEEINDKWKEPDEPPFLSKTEFEDIIVKLKSIKPFGDYNLTNISPEITNSTQYTREYFRYAVILFGRRIDIYDDSTYRIRFVRVTFNK